MSANAKSNGPGNMRVVKKEVFSDGSELIELENGTYIVKESRFSHVEILAEQPAPYDGPPPKPVRKTG